VQNLLSQDKRVIEKNSRVHSDIIYIYIYVHTQSFSKKSIFSVACIKRKILNATIEVFCLFKIFFFQNYVCEQKMSRCTRDFFWVFFDILKYAFYAFSIIGASTPMSQNTTLVD
jgi:hypothetical protein